MIKKIISLTAAFLLMFAVALPVSAKQSFKDDSLGISVEFDDDYIVLTPSNLSSNKEYLNSIGHSVSSFKKRMNESGMVYYAAPKDNSCQFQVKMSEDDFSSVTKDLTSLSDDARGRVLDTVTEKLSAEGEIISGSVDVSNGTAYIKTAVKADGFCYIQYITVAKGKYYSLTFYNNSSTLSESEEKAARDVFSTLTVKREKTSTGIASYVLTIAAISIAILAAVILCVFVIYSFVRDYRIRKDSEEVIPTRIEMRRKK